VGNYGLPKSALFLLELTGQIVKQYGDEYMFKRALIYCFNFYHISNGFTVAIPTRNSFG